jgi:hypothetical protein
MAKLSTINLSARAEAGAVFILRDYTAPIVNDTDSEDDGKRPALLGADGTRAFVVLRGIDSPRVQAARAKAQAAFQDRVTARALASQHGSKKKRGADLAEALTATADDIALQESQDIEELVAATISWSGLEQDDGSPWPCEPSNARALWAADPANREAARQFMRDREDFFANAWQPAATLPLTDSGSLAPSLPPAD